MLFPISDAVAFGDADQSMVGKGVRMEGVEGESEDANVGWITGEGDEEEDEMEMEDDEAINVDDLLEDDDGMDEDEPVTVVKAAPKAKAAKAKRAAPTNIVSVEPSSKKNKSVSFSAKPLGPTAGVASTSAAQKAKLFTANDAEAPGASSLLLRLCWAPLIRRFRSQSRSTRTSRRTRRRTRRRRPRSTPK